LCAKKKRKEKKKKSWAIEILNIQQH
jgi:hypothetical protein